MVGIELAVKQLIAVVSMTLIVFSFALACGWGTRWAFVFALASYYMESWEFTVDRLGIILKKS